MVPVAGCPRMAVRRFPSRRGDGVRCGPGRREFLMEDRLAVEVADGTASRIVPTRTWCRSATSRTLPLHACPARCGARRRCGTAKLRLAPCLPLDSSKLLRAIRAGSQPNADQRNSNINSASAARLRLLCPKCQRRQIRPSRHAPSGRAARSQPEVSRESDWVG